MTKPKILSSEIVHQNPWWRVRKDEIVTEKGKRLTFFVHESNPFVIVVALDRNRRMMFIKQYRHTTRRSGFEFPCGGINPGETPLDAAKRELREEAGCEGGEWREIGEFNNDNGQANIIGYVFLALGVEQTCEPELEDGEEGTTNEWIEEVDIPRIMRETHDGTTHIAWSFYMLNRV